MLMRIKIACVLFILSAFSTKASNLNDIIIFIRDDVYDDYNRFLNGRQPSEVKDFTGAYIRRDVVDMIIAQQALMLGGFTKSFSYHTGNVNFRKTKLLEDGKLLISFDSVWSLDAEQLAKDVYISDAVIRKGEYYAGVFTSPSNHRVLKLQKREDFKSLTAVSTPKWLTDWQTLSALPLKELLREDEWLSQVRMVSMKWVDFVMMPLMPSLKNQYHLEDIRLVAVPNIVLQLNDSRHFIISKHHPDATQAYAALQAGLKQLRKQGAIEKAYKEAGFIPNLNDYTVINSTD